ncbi:MAG: amidohydrolase family protein [Candidatus Binatia bacterium]
MQHRAIDIHHHCFPDELVQETRRHGKSIGVELSETGDKGLAISFAGSPPHKLQPGLMNVERRIDMIEKGKIALAALEASANAMGYQLDGARGESWCRLYNESLKDFAAHHSRRFFAAASVPLQEPARAAQVLEEAVVKLGHRAAFIGTNVNGRYYNTRDFDPFWAKAQELDVLIIMHPEQPAGFQRMRDYGLIAVCGNPADSTLSLGYLLYSGVFDRFPKLKLCALHGGGFLPYHLGRFDQEFATGRGSRPADAALPPSGYLKNLYFDTLVYHVDTLEYLRRKVGGDRLLLGTDYPYALGDWLAVEKVEALDCPQAEKEAILEGNARRLLKL